MKKLFGFAATIFCLLASGASYAATGATPLKCEDLEQKIYVAYAYQIAGAGQGVSALTMCVARGDEATELGLKRIHDRIERDFMRRVVIQTIIKLNS